MAKKTSLINKKPGKSLALQAQELKRYFPSSKVNVKRNKLVWICDVNPTPLSQHYTLKLEYAVGSKPCVVVIQPKLATRPNERLPHVFRGNVLCLYRSRYNEWNSQMFLWNTIVPWAILWLLYYEIWLHTGIWSGSKAEHPGAEN